MSKCSICGKETNIINLTSKKQDVEVICSLPCLDIWELREKQKTEHPKHGLASLEA